MKTQSNFFRLVREIFYFYPVRLPLNIFLILFCAAVNSIPSIFIQKIIALIENSKPGTSWTDISSQIAYLIGILLFFYALSLLGAIFVGQLGAVITQGVLMRLRNKMFEKMQNLPLKFFDSNSSGDIMSRFTNDVDSLRQMISQGIPQLLTAFITLIVILGIMIYFSLWLTIITLLVHQKISENNKNIQVNLKVSQRK